MNRYSVSTLILCGMLFAATGMTAQGAVVGVGPTASEPFRTGPTRTVWPHELMNFQERHDLWLKMRAARSPAERMALRAKKYAELEKRATKLGLALREEEPMMARYGDRHAVTPEEGYRGPRSTRREYGWPEERPYGYGAPRYGYGTPQHDPFRPMLPVAGR